MELVAVNGVFAGTAYVLAQGLIIPSTDDDSSSRRGWRIHAIDGDFTFEAADGDPSLFVNGLPASGRPLRAGDEVRLGDSLFIAREPERPPATVLDGCPVSLGHLSNTRQLAEVPFDDAVLYADDVNGQRAGADLAKLARAVGALTSVRGLAAIDSALAGFILGVVPAERVAFVDYDSDGGGALRARSGWSSAGARAIEVDLPPGLFSNGAPSTASSLDITRASNAPSAS
jgi:hypothetical protein